MELTTRQWLVILMLLFSFLIQTCVVVFGSRATMFLYGVERSLYLYIGVELAAITPYSYRLCSKLC